MSISSRYGLVNVNNSYYSSLTISGLTTNSTQLIGNTNSTLSQGYVFAPYIMAQTTSVILDRDFYKKILKDERIKKLNKLSKLYNE